MEGYSNQPIPKEAAKKLLALDLEDKEILTYEKLDQLKTVHGRIVYINEAHRYFTADADINGKNLRESFKF